MQDKESFFINLFPDAHIGDDGAVIGNSVYSKDLFCEDIHFKREWMTPEQIAYKSMLVNISDAIVMNAHPQYALIGIKIPSRFTTEEMEEIAKGFLKAAREFDFEIIGGDTVAGDKLDISVTLISRSDAPVYRKGIAEGDLLAFTGDIGSVKRDLDVLLKGDKISAESKFITPLLRAGFFYEAAPLLHAALDISDGLSKDLSRLSQINETGFDFTKSFTKEELCSGEEYEILFAFAPENREKIMQIARKHDTPVTVFATAVPGSYESVCPPNHFRG
jgi:thiamine-monophosphate kinase